MTKAKVRNLVALTVLAVGLVLLVYLLLRPGLMPYLAVDALRARQGELTGVTIRLAGLLDSPVTSQGGESAFSVAMRNQSVPVVYRGPLPSNVKLGQELLLDGRLEPDGRFHATQVLTQCASRYRAKLDRPGESATR